MKKGSLLLVVLMIAFSLFLCACEDKKEEVLLDNGEETNVEVEENIEEEAEGEFEEEEIVVDPADLEKLVIELNGSTLKIGEKFADVKDSFEKEVKPSQSYTPCGGSDDAQNITHYYDGLEVEETADGIIYYAKISGFDYPVSNASIAGIKLGDTPETVRANFGTKPYVDSEYTINYAFGDINISFGLDVDETGNVNYISMDDFSVSGF